jgi:sentrin-specific protease 1
VSSVGEVISSGEGFIQVTRRQFRTLRPKKWVDDTTMDFYSTLLTRRGNRKDFQGMKTYFFSVFFYSALVHPKTKKYDFAAVQSWTDFVADGILSYDQIMIPVNIDGVHWALVVVHLKDRTIEYLDSLGYGGLEIMNYVGRYLDDYVAEQCLTSLDAANFVKRAPKVISQKDDFSCGVFVLAFQDFRALGRPLSFSLDDIATFRKKIAQDILIG